MATIVHDHGLEQFGGWSGLDVRALLLKSTASPTKSMQYVSDLISGSVELSVTGYARQTLTGEAESVDTTNHWLKLTANTITFSGMSGSDQTAGFLSLYVHNASDSAAVVLITYDIPNVALGTTNTSVTYAFPSNGIRLAQNGVIA